MRSRISLYIGDRRAELDDDTLVLFSYTFDDLANPTSIVNSYSRQITLRGTPTNNRIFGEVFRLDRQQGAGGTGSSFNSSKKTPFTIYNERGEILQTGYMKLDRVNRDGKDVSYAVTLYGGLGSFLYALSYKEDGDKKTLADLDYLGTNDSETELDFTINQSAVATAWAASLNSGDIDSIWKVINFAPCYNGIPQTKFAANKGLAVPTSIGLPSSISDGGKTYTTRSGLTLVDLAKAVDENAVKDLRSYLQRPVFSMRAFFAALAKSMNNGGYTFDKSILEDSAKFPYQNLWMTLPMLPSINVNPGSSAGSLTLSTSYTSSENIARYDVVGTVPAGAIVSSSVHFVVDFAMDDAASESSLYLYYTDTPQEGTTAYHGSCIFIQLLAYGSDDTLVGGSNVKTLCGIPYMSGEWFAEQMGFTPAYPGVNYDAVIRQPSFVRLSSSGGGTFQMLEDFTFNLEARNVAYYKVRLVGYTYDGAVTSGGTTIVTHSAGGIDTMKLISSSKEPYDVTQAKITTNGGDTCTISTPDNLRSNAHITKRMLLSTSATPADYLVSFCKTFGLVLKYDDPEKKVTLMRRREFFQDTTTDLTGRVDLSKAVDITPLAFSAKWYQFAPEVIAGSFAEQYRALYGRTYGSQRVNTGYEFNAEVRELLNNYVFKTAADLLSKSRFNCDIFQDSVFRPSPFLDAGNRFTLWTDDAAHESHTEDVPIPTGAAVVSWFNSFRGYDLPGSWRPQLCDDEGKPVGDGANVLLISQGGLTMPYYKLTDDVAAMDELCDGQPCWFIGAGYSSGVTVQHFSRYKSLISNRITQALDFGVPAEIQIPGYEYDATAPIYPQAWAAYIADKFDANTKVLHCFVDMRGLKVDADLLRGFYYYGGSLWTLNRIVNYSLTTSDPVECEFVQVQDKNAYIGGQF